MDRNDFLREETRCEYMIPVSMKKIWQRQMDLLETFMRICADNHLTYFALGGTALGAIRHGGYIPWDDDIDVGMPREDYARFLEVAPGALQAPYFLQTPLTEKNYFRLFARLRNSDTTGIADKKHRYACNNGIFLDIFPLDSYDEKSLRSRLMWLYSDRLQRLCDQKIKYAAKARHSLKGRLLYLLSKPVNLRRAFIRHQNACLRASNIKTTKIGQVFTATRMYPLKKMTWMREDFEKTVLMDFEYLKIPVPAGFDRFMKTMYGDYMAFPPVEKRGLHHTIEFDPDTPYKIYCARHYGVKYEE